MSELSKCIKFIYDFAYAFCLIIANFYANGQTYDAI